VIDVGTGAGFPGVPLKIAEPTMDITLLDSLAKRLTFLDEVIELCGLDNSRTNFGVASGIVAAVIADGAGLFTFRLRQICRQAPCGLTHGIVIEIRRTECHHAADACRAETLLRAETGNNLPLIERAKFRLFFLSAVRKPALIFFFCNFFHIAASFSYCILPYYTTDFRKRIYFTSKV
ncbi:MAG: class I SAM-dependent methyltransferase, partial [Oscillospiraceae bacterium]|nr:class I SAM-dependent methyltransferase [Oscillospiraceae bacterium]